MSVIGGAFGNVPGTDSAYTTYENAFSWGLPNTGRGLILPCPILATAVDAGASPTWRLRPGLVLGKITSTGKLKQYDATATDGSQIAFGVLMQGLAMQDPYSGSTRDKFLGVLVSGPLQGAALYGLDQKARGDLKAQGCIFDDDPHGANWWRLQETAAGGSGLTVTMTTSTYLNGTHIFITSGGGASTFTLPPVVAGLRYKFTNGIDQSLTVRVPTADLNKMTTFNNVTTADAVAFSTSSEKIGGSVELYSYYDAGTSGGSGTAGYRWMVQNASAGANTITVVTNLT